MSDDEQDANKPNGREFPPWEDTPVDAPVQIANATHVRALYVAGNSLYAASVALLRIGAQERRATHPTTAAVRTDIARALLPVVRDVTEAIRACDPAVAEALSVPDGAK